MVQSFSEEKTKKIDTKSLERYTKYEKKNKY